MKEGFVFGAVVGMAIGIGLHKYCKNVQRLATKSEQFVFEELDMIRQEAKKAQEEIKQTVKKAN